MGHRKSDRNPPINSGKAAANAGNEESSIEWETSSESENLKHGFPGTGSNPKESGARAAIDGGASPFRGENAEDESDSSCSEGNPNENSNCSSAEDSSSIEGGGADEDESEEEAATGGVATSNVEDGGAPIVEDAVTNSDKELSEAMGCENGAAAPSREFQGPKALLDLGKKSLAAGHSKLKASNSDLKIQRG